MGLDIAWNSQAVIESNWTTPTDPVWLEQFQPNYNFAASESSTSISQNPPLIQQDLYFDLTRINGNSVSDTEFQQFVDSKITPQFSAGLTVFDATGNASRNLGENSVKIVTLYAEDTFKQQAAINQIIESYRQQFGSSVLQVTNENDLKVGFGAGENLIENDPSPELIQVELFFGRNIGGIEGVTQEQFGRFVDMVITPRFPDGLTNFDANGQFLSSNGQLIREPSEVVSLILEDTEANETAIDEIVTQYIEQFQQESVLISVNEDVKVAFDSTQDVIDNNLIPEQIQVDLFFGRNIGGVEGVSEEQFQNFVDTAIADRFNQFTVTDADGQFLSSTGTLVKEKSKQVSLIMRDTQANENAVNSAITEYIQSFQQESVLIVVDEEINANLERTKSKLLGTKGNDTLTGSTANDVAFGFDGDDQLVGNEGNDRLFGGNGLDVLSGDAGNDFLSGGNDDDLLLAREGDDFASGGDGNDDIEGGEGHDRLFGGDGIDDILGDAGNDQVFGGKGDDQIFGDAINLLGEPGNDTLYGDDGDDSLFGNAGDDQLFGGKGSDGLFGDAGNDKLFGDDDRDILFGGADNDTLRGGKGDDVLIGDAGDDLLLFDAGQDAFSYSTGKSVSGSDIVKGFQRGAGGDLVAFEQIAAIDVITVGNNTQFRLSDGVQGNPGFGTGDLLVTLEKTAGFTADNIGANVRSEINQAQFLFA
jgi:Ca2+-binding RTX toxin-like protein